MADTPPRTGAGETETLRELIDGTARAVRAMWHRKR